MIIIILVVELCLPTTYFLPTNRAVMDEVVRASFSLSHSQEVPGKKWQLLKMDKLIGRRPKEQDRNWDGFEERELTLKLKFWLDLVRH